MYGDLSNYPLYDLWQLASEYKGLSFTDMFIVTHHGVDIVSDVDTINNVDSETKRALGKALAPEYEKAATELKAKNIQLAKVDCT